jgi:hypothetical protein
MKWLITKLLIEQPNSILFYNYKLDKRRLTCLSCLIIIITHIYLYFQKREIEKIIGTIYFEEAEMSYIANVH